MIDDKWFWLVFLALSLPLASVMDYAINHTVGRPEWFWQTVARLRKEHQRLYPKGKP